MNKNKKLDLPKRAKKQSKVGSYRIDPARYEEAEAECWRQYGYGLATFIPLYIDKFFPPKKS